MTIQLNHSEFYTNIRPEFGVLRSSQVEGFNVFLNMFSSTPKCKDVHAAYVLATCDHETGRTMQPIVERGSRKYIESRYDAFKGSTQARRKRARDMGNVRPGDGWLFRGRGYPQLTWANNYKRLGARIGLGNKLYENPDLVLRPDIAVAVTWEGMYYGLFTGVGMPTFLDRNVPDWYNCRKTVNWLDQAKKIADLASRVYLPAIRRAAA